MATLVGCSDPAGDGAFERGAGGAGMVPVEAGQGGAAAGGGSVVMGGAGMSGVAPVAGGGSGGALVGGAAGAAGSSGAGGSAGAAGGNGLTIDHGDEYVWIDQDFHWDQGTDANVADHGPVNWYDDQGRNYHDGKIEFRVTIASKADATPVWHELCHWQNSLGDPAHVCLHCLPLYTAPGEYTCETTASQQGGPVDYHEPFVAVQNRVKDGTSGRGLDLITLEKGLPIEYHYTVVLVPAGQNFSGWDKYPH